MSKTTLLVGAIVCAVVVIGGGAAFFLFSTGQSGQAANTAQDTSDTSDTSDTTTTGTSDLETQSDTTEAIAGSGTLAELLSRGRNLQCTWTYDDTDTPMSGTAYITPDQFRSEAEIVVEGETMSYYMIGDEEVMYSWTEGSFNPGFGMIIRPGEMAEAAPTDAETESGQPDTPSAEDMQAFQDVATEYNYECEPWTVDRALFEVPQDIEFREMNDLIPDMTEMQQQLLDQDITGIPQDITLPPELQQFLE